MPSAKLTAIVCCSMLVAAAPSFATSGQIGDAAASRDYCRKADQLAGAERKQVLDRGLALAERAVAADPRDADARFGIVCNLGKLVKDRGGIGALFDLRRIRSELDTALELRPEDPDLLAAKGAMLCELPRLLGGDEKQGEAILRRVLAKDPHNARALRHLSLHQKAAAGSASTN